MKEIIKVKINFDNGLHEDSFVIEGENLEDIRAKVYAEMDRRGLDERCCWSEILTKE